MNRSPLQNVTHSTPLWGRLSLASVFIQSPQNLINLGHIYDGQKGCVCITNKVRKLSKRAFIYFHNLYISDMINTWDIYINTMLKQCTTRWLKSYFIDKMKKCWTVVLKTTNIRPLLNNPVAPVYTLTGIANVYLHLWGKFLVGGHVSF